MAIRKNKKRIDPRWFMDEKTETIVESPRNTEVDNVPRGGPPADPESESLDQRRRRKARERREREREEAGFGKAKSKYFEEDLDEGKESLAQWEAVAITPEEVKKDDQGVYYIVPEETAMEASRKGAVSVQQMADGKFLVRPGSMSRFNSAT
jgi:hypothetical protein